MKIPAIRIPSIQMNKKIVYMSISAGTSLAITGTFSMVSGAIAVLSWLTTGSATWLMGSME